MGEQSLALRRHETQSHASNHLARFITRSAAAQCSSDTHSSANASMASMGVTPAITRLIRPAGRLANDRASVRHSSSNEARGHHPVDQPPPFGLVRGEHGAGSREQQCLALADQRGQPLGAAPGRHDLQGHLVEADLHVVGGDPDIGGDGDFGSTTERCPLSAAMTGAGKPAIRSQMARIRQPLRRLPRWCAAR